MKTAGVLACCLLVFPLVGTVSKHVARPTAGQRASTGAHSAQRATWEALLGEGGKLFQQGRYGEAAERCESARQPAAAAGEWAVAARATRGLGACQYALHQYRPALRSFLEAHRLAEAAADRSCAALVDVNLASLYSLMGELDAAVEWTARSVERMSGDDRRRHLPEVQIQMAALRARQERLPEALELFRQGIEGAGQAGDRAVYAVGWNRMGEELLRTQNSENLPLAERALLEAYRVRKLDHLALEGSYCNLGRLRLEQGDLESASVLLDRAIEIGVRPEGGPARDAYHLRGLVRLRQGRLREALEDLRIALRLERAWRWSAPSSESTLIGTEGLLAETHSALIEAGNRLYLETHEPRLMEETFEAAEENRAASLRALLNGRSAAAPELPPAYWVALGELQRAELASLRNHERGTTEAVDAARAELSRMEAALIPDYEPPPAGVLDRVQAALDPDTALLGFHLGASTSWLWAVDRTRIALYALPAEVEVAAQVAAAAEAIREDRPDRDAAGAKLYHTLFAPLAARFAGKTRWLLALDTKLFDAPVAALRDDPGPDGVPVVERHITQVIPGAAYWLESEARRSASPVSGVFVGVGDPIYNPADPRWRRRTAIQSGGLMLPRLVGSGSEVEACARAWQGESVLLTGAEASRLLLTGQLERNPAVVHFATHILESAGAAKSRAGSGYGLIALSMTESGETQLLEPAEIAHWKTRVGSVVLSGCHSAGGAALPGTGLLGLTRAWLTAGARSVVGSRWATLDEDGALFGAFYRDLRAGRRADAAEALRAAQLDMIRAGGWRARPRYWGAYFVVGNP